MVKQKIPKRLKDLIWEKYVGEYISNAKCFCCQSTNIKMNDFDCGHIISEFNNGATNIDNLIPICRQCNSSMSKQNMHEFMINIGIFDKNLRFQKIVSSNKNLYEMVYNYKKSKNLNYTNLLPLLIKKNEREVKPTKMDKIENIEIKPNTIERIEIKPTKIENIEIKTNKIENTNNIAIDDRTCIHCKKRFDYPCLLDRHLNSKKGCKELRNKNRIINTPQLQEEIVNHTQILISQEQELPQKQEQELPQQEQLQNPIENIVTNKLQCKYCKFIFKNRSGLTQHINKLRCDNLTVENIDELKAKIDFKLFKKQALLNMNNIKIRLKTFLIK
jgi:hypothetical protein